MQLGIELGRFTRHCSLVRFQANNELSCSSFFGLFFFRFSFSSLPTTMFHARLELMPTQISQGKISRIFLFNFQLGLIVLRYGFWIW